MTRLRTLLFPAVPGILLAGTLLSSCAGKKTTSDTTMAAEHYMPLQTGNHWVYNYDAGGEPLRQVLLVTGTEEHRGHSWAVVQTAIGEGTTPEKTLLRTEGSRLLMYHPRLDEEIVQVDFAALEPDSAHEEIAYIKKKAQRVEIAGKTLHNCVVTGSAYSDAGVTTYAPGIGPVQEYWFRGHRELASATIGGRAVFPDAE